MTFLIISPHCDDIALSLGGMLLNEVFYGKKYAAIIFSESAYMDEKIIVHNQKEITHLRKSEELSVSKLLNYQTAFLGLGEPFVRSGFKKLEDICDEKRDPNCELIINTLKESIDSLLYDYNGFLLIPLGLGNHIDHRLTNIVVTNYLLQSNAFDRIFPIYYEELPYAYYESKVSENFIIAGQLHKRYVVPFSDITQKCNILKQYKSQMTKDYYDSVFGEWKKQKGEALWLSAKTKAKLIEDKALCAKMI